ncbi:nitroreductase family protein [Deltaproteobacteria bacterium TL4]
MNISINEEKCNACMLCVQDCISGVFRNMDNVPVVVDIESCNRCSHCVSVCPLNIIEHDAMDKSQIRRRNKRLLDPEVYAEIVKTRRSIRQYKDKPVSKEVLEQIIDLARYSPTASNLQDVRYIVVTDKALLQKISSHIFSWGERFFQWTQSGVGKPLFHAMKSNAFVKSMDRYVGTMEYYIQQRNAGRDFILHNAPLLVLIHAPSKSHFGCDNCNIAAANFTNYAHSLGLGTCYIGFLTMALKHSKKLKKWLRVPPKEEVFASLVLGHPAYSHLHTVSRKQPPVTWIE